MKNTYLLLLLVIIMSCGKYTDVSKLPKTIMTFKHPNRKYNPIVKGKVLEMSFQYTNEGDHPLVISEIQTSCNCTISDYTTRAIGKGQSGYINLHFDSFKNLGNVKQYVTIIANVENTLANTISFETRVISKPKKNTDYEEAYFKKHGIKVVSGWYIPTDR